jgi:hypothetical protein
MIFSNDGDIGDFVWAAGCKYNHKMVINATSDNNI